nr:MAG TPA: hypothetical protein [Caudoviricetes sp.]
MDDNHEKDCILLTRLLYHIILCFSIEKTAYQLSIYIKIFIYW